MTVSEFKAWFDGFTHGKAHPSEYDWQVIVAKIKELSDGKPSYAPVFGNNFVPSSGARVKPEPFYRSSN